MSDNKMTNDVDAPELGKGSELPPTPEGGQIVPTPADTVRTPDNDLRREENPSPEAPANSTDPSEDLPTDPPGDQDQDTFPRAYVEKLRQSEAKYRDRAGKSDELARRLHAALVAADGRLADPEDLEFNEDHLEDPDALAAAVADLITRKPGLRAQKITGDVGAGKRGSDPKPSMDLLNIIRGM